MDGVLRGAVIYLILFVLFRVFGKRTLAQVTPFDFVVLLIVGEATQQALLGDNFSITQAAVVIATLLLLERLWDLLAWRFPRFRRVAESRPLVLMVDGVLDRQAMRRVQVTEEDILQAARAGPGVERMDQIKHVVLESTGGLSIIPRG
ncbi:MAG TPA: YetF domain-containing protein [Natronosporangium sp.]|nr:YetF domain-containing protein [Natronosporangium sp.]